MEHGKHMKGPKKAAKVMREFHKGDLHMGKTGKKVPSNRPDIAKAIAMSEAGMSRKKKEHKSHGSGYRVGIGSHITYER